MDNKESTGIRSFFKAIGSFFYAWRTFGEAMELKAEAELLEAIKQKMKSSKNFSDSEPEELENAEKLLTKYRQKVSFERQRILLLSLPIVIVILIFYLLSLVVIEALRIIFN